MFYIDLYLYLHWNNAHKLFKVKAAGSQIPQSDLRGKRREREKRGSKREIPSIGFAVCFCVSASISVFHSFVRERKCQNQIKNAQNLWRFSA